MRTTRECAYCGKRFIVGGRGNPNHTQRYCSHVCAGLGTRPNSENAFWAKVRKGQSADDCWIWTGCVEPGGGYGALTYKGKRITAHRLAYTFANGPIPRGLFVCHTCDNPICVNPAHLFLGTAIDNSDDMDAKGRRRTGTLRGEQSHFAKLTDSDVLAIRELCAAGHTQKSIAQQFGMSAKHIGKIVRREAWKHI